MIEHCIKIHGIEYRFVGALLYDGGSHYRSLAFINGKYLEYDGIRIKKLKWIIERKYFDEGWYAGKLWYVPCLGDAEKSAGVKLPQAIAIGVPDGVSIGNTKSKLTGPKCEVCKREIMPGEHSHCVVIKDPATETTPTQRAMYYHLPKCCLGLKTRRNDILAAIEATSHSSHTKAKFKRSLKGVVFDHDDIIFDEEEESLCYREDDLRSIAESTGSSIEVWDTKGCGNKAKTKRTKNTHEQTKKPHKSEDGSISSLDSDPATSGENRFEVGYKFQYRMQKNSVEVVTNAIIKEVGERLGSRLVKYYDSDESSEWLGVEDIEDCEVGHKHRYSLRVGDVITFKKIAYPYGFVTEPVTAIADDCFGELTVKTNAFENMMPGINDNFQLAEASKYDDAPPVGKSVSMDDVNLIRGDARKGEENRRKRKARDDGLVTNTLGAEAAVLAVATEKAMKKFKRSPLFKGSSDEDDPGDNDKVEEDKNTQDGISMEHKYAVGTKMKKRFRLDKKSRRTKVFEGVVQTLTFDKDFGIPLYKVWYEEDNDAEELIEEDLERLITK